MTFQYDFIGAGGLAYDLVMSVKSLPLADEKYTAEIIGKLPGGSIANATCAAGRLGLRASYIGWVGSDAEGEMLRRAFLDYRVEPDGLITMPGMATPFTIVITDQAGKRSILIPHFPLYNAELTHDQVMLAAQARVVLTMPRDFAWCSQFRAATVDGGGLFALDIENTVPMLRDEIQHVIRMADIVFFSETSLKRLNLPPIHKQVEARQWMIMTAGSKGAYGIEHGRRKPVFQPGRKVTAVDTTGAGDCFHAALIAAKLDGATLAEALKFASAAASLKVLARGARGGLPTRSEVENVLRMTRW
jgi:sugar/nucleoside kinase (ribokinase family)